MTDEPRPGARRSLSDAKVEAVIARTLETRPDNATPWSTRSMAEATGLSQSAVVRIWHAFGLQPHKGETFKLSADPYFVEKVRDVVELYLHPPERAIVLSLDEKSQVQALDRTQPLLPLGPGQQVTLWMQGRARTRGTGVPAASAQRRVTMGGCRAHRPDTLFSGFGNQNVRIDMPSRWKLPAYPFDRVLRWKPGIRERNPHNRESPWATSCSRGG